MPNHMEWQEHICRILANNEFLEASTADWFKLKQLEIKKQTVIEHTWEAHYLYHCSLTYMGWGYCVSKEILIHTQSTHPQLIQ